MSRKKVSIYSRYLKLEPFKYQKIGIDFGLSHHYQMICDEMGLGKSAQAIGISVISKSKTLVICPAFLKYNWEDEYIKFSKQELKISIDRFQEDADVIITNYERLKDSEHLFKWAEMVIADECHYLKNIKAMRTKAFHQFIYDHRPARLTLLSGTPITGKIPDWYSLILLCSYNPQNTSGVGISNIDYHHFCNKFCNIRMKRIFGRNVREYYGHKNVSGLKKLLLKKYIRRLCKDVLDLKKIIEHDVTISKDKLDKEYIEAMNEADVEGVWMKVKTASAASKAEPGAEFVNNLLEDGSGPIVYFSDHKRPIEILKSKLPKRRIAIINGETDMEERHKIVKHFQAGRYDVLAGTIGAMSTGLTLTKSNVVIFNDMSANPAANAQAIKRVHRIGQDKPVHAYFFTSSKLDKRIVQILKEKMKTMREAM